jgi:hypothetical protein
MGLYWSAFGGHRERIGFGHVWAASALATASVLGVSAAAAYLVDEATAVPAAE